MMDVPDMDALVAAMETQGAADAMEYDGVLPETLVILVGGMTSSWGDPWAASARPLKRHSRTLVQTTPLFAGASAVSFARLEGDDPPVHAPERRDEPARW